MPTKAGVTRDSPSTTSHWLPVSDTVSRSRCSMDSSTAAQVSTQPAMIQPKYGKSGEDHGASRSRRMTTPKLTALNETSAKAIVMEVDPVSVLGSPGPQASRPNAMPATRKPLMAHRISCGRFTILVPGERGGRCMTLGSGTSTMNPTTTVTTTKNLQNSSCKGKSATPWLMLRMVAYTINCRTEDRIVSCNLMYDEIRR